MIWQLTVRLLKREKLEDKHLRLKDEKELEQTLVLETKATLEKDLF